MLAIPRPALPAIAAPGERLQDLPAALADDLLACGVQRQWQRGQQLMRQGTPCDSLVVALQGRLAVHLAGPGGRDTLLRWLDDGELVGLPGVLAGLPATVDIVAQGPARTLHVARADFLGLLQRHPDGAIATAVLVSRRLGEVFRMLEMGQGRSLTDRVDDALQRLAQRQGLADADGSLRLKITQTELADAAGASRQRVHLVLQQLQQQGRIRLGYGWVTLLPDANQVR
jgi:CRP-like cAMP-binding protein